MSQRVCVLGGGGDVGTAIGAVLDDAGLTPVLADIDDPVEHTDAGSLNAETATIDVTAQHAADRLDNLAVSGVISAVGPFDQRGTAAARTAIQAGVPYVDICDDYQTTRAILDLDTQAKDAEIPAVVGCGWTPGLSSLLAAWLIRTHNTRSITIDWVGSAADATGTAAISHLLDTIAGSSPVIQDGVVTETRAGQHPRSVRLPELGAATTVRCGHPEPLTLARTFDLQTATVNVGVLPRWQTRLLVSLGRARLTTKPQRRRFMTRLLAAGEPLFANGAPQQSGMVVAGEQTQIGVTGRMRTLTARPAVEGMLRLLEGDYPAGVHTAGSLFDPDSFLSELLDDSLRWYRRTDGPWCRLQTL